MQALKCLYPISLPQEIPSMHIKTWRGKKRGHVYQEVRQRILGCASGPDCCMLGFGRDCLAGAAAGGKTKNLYLLSGQQIRLTANIEKVRHSILSMLI